LVCTRLSGLRVGRNQKGYGLGSDLDADRQIAEKLALRLTGRRNLVLARLLLVKLLKLINYS